MAIIKGSQVKVGQKIVISKSDPALVIKQTDANACVVRTGLQGIIRETESVYFDRVLMLARPGQYGSAVGNDTQPNALSVNEPITDQIPIAPIISAADVEREKQVLMAQVQNEVESYRGQQMAQIEQEKKKILDSAYQSGYDTGLKEGREKLESTAATLFKAVDGLAQERTKIAMQMKPDILDLVMASTERAFQQTLTLKREVLIGVIEDAIKRITDKDKVIIRVHASDAALVRANREKFMAQMSDIKKLEIQEDAQITAGGCIIETRLGYIDATVETKLDAIKKALFQTYDEELKENGGNGQTAAQKGAGADVKPNVPSLEAKAMEKSIPPAPRAASNVMDAETMPKTMPKPFPAAGSTPLAAIPQANTMAHDDADFEHEDQEGAEKELPEFFDEKQDSETDLDLDEDFELDEGALKV